MESSSKHSIYINKLRLNQENSRYTVSAIVDGEPLWFQCTDHALRIAPEGFANALLVQAVFLGRDLVFEDPLCPVWLEHAQQLMAIYHEWWGLPPVAIRSPQQEKPVHYKGDKTGLCFSGGVDSFHSLSTYPESIDFIIMVHGYDISLADEAGAAHASRNLREVAREYAVTPLTISTNLRQHHVAGKRYRYSFEGALAAIGYLLEDVQTLIISSDYSREALQQLDFKPGSHWASGPLRSSADITIVHYGEQYTRDEKLRQIAGNPLLRKHLRVCQQNFKPGFELAGHYLNCGTCDKCMRTLIPIMQTTGLAGYECFANTKHLEQCINQIEHVDNYTCMTYEKFCRIGVEPGADRAIRALVWRSRCLNKHHWLGRKGKHLLARLFIAWHKAKERVMRKA